MTPKTLFAALYQSNDEMKMLKAKIEEIKDQHNKTINSLSLQHQYELQEWKNNIEAEKHQLQLTHKEIVIQQQQIFQEKIEQLIRDNNSLKSEIQVLKQVNEIGSPKRINVKENNKSDQFTKTEPTPSLNK